MSTFPRCFAAVVFASAQIAGGVLHAQTCPDPGPVVPDVGFTDSTRLAWESPPGALGFNVYLQRAGIGTASFAGECLYSAIPENTTLLHGRPPAGRPWMFQVTGLFEEGEGPMGFTSECVPRAPIRPCTCTLPADPGPCTAFVPRWFLDFRTFQCEEFIWGGCRGNANNFVTREACKAACLDPCKLPAVVGPCDAALPRWYFSPLSGHCEPFAWGGCGGNANNFPDTTACRATCGDVCLLPLDPGPCDGTCPRWYHDAATGQCQEFIWGCCGGNGNNFETREACVAECRTAD